MFQSPEPNKYRIQLALQYMSLHLEDDITLPDLAQAAYFSPFHFHRVFTAIVKETPNVCLRRMRLERAANLLLNRRAAPLLDIALHCGFKSQSLFSRAFKSHFDMTPTAWRKGGFWRYDGAFWQWRPVGQDSKPCKMDGLADEVNFSSLQKRCGQMQSAAQGICPQQILEIKVLQRPAVRRVYRWSPAGSDEAVLQLWAEVLQWADRRGLCRSDAMGVSRLQDNPNITGAALSRFEAGILVDSHFLPQRGELCDELPGGRFVQIEFTGTLRDERLVYEYLYGYWLAANQWEVDERPGFALVPVSNTEQEINLARPFHYWVCIPIRRIQAGI